MNRRQLALWRRYLARTERARAAVQYVEAWWEGRVVAGGEGRPERS